MPRDPPKITFSRKLAQRARFEVLQKPRTLPRVVWAEESKTGLVFEIGPRQRKNASVAPMPI